jgi:RHS repeat-associated protein
MRPNRSLSFTRPVSSISNSMRRIYRHRFLRSLIVFVLLFSFLLAPSPQLAHEIAASISASVGSGATQTIKLSTRLFSFFFQSAHASQVIAESETLADRLAQVAQVQITPRRFVGYIGQTVAFRALPLNASGQTIQGVRFDWQSSDASKVQIDDDGQAHLLHPGLVRITCLAGTAQASIPLLVRPGARPMQSDADWQADQQNLSASASPDNPAGPIETLEGLAAQLMPTAHAQSSGSSDLAYDEMWNDPRNLVGTPRNRAVEGTRIGAVLPEGSNFSFAAPIISLGGRGVGASLTLYYNSRVWSRRNNTMAFDAINGWPAPGFALGFGRVVAYDVGPNATCKYMLIDPDGTRHYLGAGYYNQTGTYQTNDGSHITFIGSAQIGGNLMFNDGTDVYMPVVNNRVLPAQIIDANGNYVQIAYKDSTQGYGELAIDYITDTLGRVIQFNYDANYRLTSITAPGFSGTSQNPVTRTLVQFDYQTVTTSGTFSGLTVERSTGGSITTLKHITFPATGTGYMPSYSIYGVVTSMSARRQMGISQPDGIESNKVAFNYPTTGPISDAPAFTQRTETATNAPTATYTYSSSTDSVAQTKTFTITRPDNSPLNLTRSTNASLVANGLIVRSEVKSSSGASMGKSEISYANDPGGQPQVANIINYDDGSPTPNQTKVDFDYDSYGNVINVRDYGFQVSGQWQVRRRTHNVYTVIANSGPRLSEMDLYDAQLDTNDANDVLVAKTTYAYDNYQAMGGMEVYTGQPNAPGHRSWYDASYTTRGNVTGVTQWYDLANNLSYTRLRKIDIYGNVVKEQLSCCNEETLTATQTSYWAAPEQVTKGTTGGTQLTYSRQYDFNTLATKTSTDANNLTTTVNSYDAALRPSQVTMPSGATVSASYSDGTLSVSGSKSYNDGGTQKTVAERTDYDGWGRVIDQVDANGGQVNTTYDAMGQVASVSNPFTAGGSPSYWTNYTYDALSRATVVTLPDTQTVRTNYNGNSATVTDQANRKIQQLADGLGRLVTVNEQDSSGNLTQATNYTYDYLDNLTQVNQGNQLRSYKYDALSRLLYEKVPEQTASINDGTGTYWTSKYTYTDFNAIATRQDARGVVTTYSYDTLHRLSQVTYNTVAGVTTAPTVSYGYDSDSSTGTTATGQLVSTVVGSSGEYQEHYTYDIFMRPASTIRKLTGPARTYTTSYNYNDGGQMIQLTYASGLAVAISHDSAGRVSGLQNASTLVGYLSQVSYDIAGQVTGDVLGNGVVEEFGYDSARMQMKTQKATKTTTSGGGGICVPPPCPPPTTTTTTYLDLTYSYNASAGQMGVGSTAGNAGQLMSVSGTINSTTESASYTYDNYGRLMTSNQTSNGTSAQRRFAYDRWSNRTGVWDATSGGTQIQSASLQQSGGVPTNRLTSLTNNSTTLNYTYDANGNVTNDGLHSYAYDSENRLVSVDLGTAASYAYDQQNRRYKKTVGSAVTHYVWENSQVVAEYNGSTGAVQAEYVYSGSHKAVSVLSGATYYHLSDQLSLRLTLDGAGSVTGRQAHLPFGEDFAESGIQQKQHFTSYERDSESGLDYALNRGYAVSAGRFMQADPYKTSGSTSAPQSWNRYAYVKNDPINLIDPIGLFAYNPPPLNPNPSVPTGYLAYQMPGYYYGPPPVNTNPPHPTPAHPTVFGHQEWWNMLKFLDKLKKQSKDCFNWIKKQGMMGFIEEFETAPDSWLVGWKNPDADQPMGLQGAPSQTPHQYFLEILERIKKERGTDISVPALTVGDLHDGVGPASVRPIIILGPDYYEPNVDINPTAKQEVAMFGIEGFQSITLLHELFHVKLAKGHNGGWEEDLGLGPEPNAFEKFFVGGCKK